MNSALGNVGKTVFYTDPLEANSVDQRQSLQELVNDIDAGRVELLVIIGGNPVYNTPADLKLDQSGLFKAKLRVHLSQYKDETSELCHWHIPEAHYLEVVGRHAFIRRHSHDRAAADRAALRRQDRARSCWQCSPSSTTASLTRSFENTGRRSQADSRRADSSSSGRSSSAGAVSSSGTSSNACSAAAPAPTASRRLILRPGGASACTMDLFPTTRLPAKTVSAQVGDAQHQCSGNASDPTPSSRHPARSKLSSAPIRRSTTVALQTTAGCRNCRSR